MLTVLMRYNNLRYNYVFNPVSHHPRLIFFRSLVTSGRLQSWLDSTVKLEYFEIIGGNVFTWYSKEPYSKYKFVYSTTRLVIIQFHVLNSSILWNRMRSSYKVVVQGTRTRGILSPSSTIFYCVWIRGLHNVDHLFVHCPNPKASSSY